MNISGKILSNFFNKFGYYAGRELQKGNGRLMRSFNVINRRINK